MRSACFFAQKSITLKSMKNFILLYNGHATDAKDMSDEARNAVMAKWGAWMGKVGNDLINVGQPMVKEGVSVVDDGSFKTPTELNGFSIIQAEDMEKAKAMINDHPFLSDKTGKFSVDIYELMPTPKM